PVPVYDQTQHSFDGRDGVAVDAVCLCVAQLRAGRSAQISDTCDVVPQPHDSGGANECRSPIQRDVFSAVRTSAEESQEVQIDVGRLPKLILRSRKRPQTL